MFVRWKHRQGKGGTSHYAYLVQSERMSGQPRLRVVSYLGSIKDAERTQAVVNGPHISGRYEFWSSVRRILSHVQMEGHLDVTTRQKVEVQLAAVVPALTPAEDEAAERHIEESSRAMVAFVAPDWLPYYDAWDRSVQGDTP
jgi:hypothetical protein